MPNSLKDINAAALIALAAAAGGLLISFGLVTNAVEQHWLALASIFIPLAFVVGKSVLQWAHITPVALIAVITAVVGGIVQAGFIDSDKGKSIVGLATVVVPVAFILVHTVAGFNSHSVPSRGGNGPKINGEPQSSSTQTLQV